MADNYRYWCGECGYHTPWLTESQGADAQMTHYIQRHPGIPPGGRVEFRQRPTGGGGCLGVVAALFLILLLASTCQHGSQSAPQIPPAVHLETR
ncbi:hypothetical protein [Amycolatopsis pigmentata]|uniref:Uncharacterized protein n=1 Tax=Amycolatopsis pigmentata TaxID=450801 RepID=A0ABW5FY56_9PSEU